MSMDIWVPDASRHKKEVECFFCDGTGKDHEYPCGLCDGAGTRMVDVSDAPEYNLSNSNASAIMRLLGFEDSEAWTIDANQLPEVRRKIIRLLNVPGELERGVRSPSDTQHTSRERYRDPETGLQSIRPVAGPRMIDYGIDTEYLKRRLNNFLEVIEYAQKHGSEVVVG